MTEYVWVNDVYLIPFYLRGIGIGLIILFSCLIIHELGHVLFFLIRKKRLITLQWKGLRCEAGILSDYENLTDKEYKQVNSWGITAGLIPLLFAAIFWAGWFLIIFPYAVAIRQDIGEVIKTINWED